MLSIIFFSSAEFRDHARKKCSYLEMKKEMKILKDKMNGVYEEQISLTAEFGSVKKMMKKSRKEKCEDGIIREVVDYSLPDV